MFVLPLAGDKTAGLPFCTAQPPEGRAPWMARVYVPKADEGALEMANQGCPHPNPLPQAGEGEKRSGDRFGYPLA